MSVDLTIFRCDDFKVVGHSPLNGNAITIELTHRERGNGQTTSTELAIYALPDRITDLLVEHFTAKS